MRFMCFCGRTFSDYEHHYYIVPDEELLEAEERFSKKPRIKKELFNSLFELNEVGDSVMYDCPNCFRLIRLPTERNKVFGKNEVVTYRLERLSEKCSLCKKITATIESPPIRQLRTVSEQWAKKGKKQEEVRVIKFKWCNLCEKGTIYFMGVDTPWTLLASFVYHSGECTYEFEKFFWEPEKMELAEQWFSYLPEAFIPRILENSFASTREFCSEMAETLLQIGADHSLAISVLQRALREGTFDGKLKAMEVALKLGKKNSVLMAELKKLLEDEIKNIRKQAKLTIEQFEKFEE